MYLLIDSPALEEAAADETAGLDEATAELDEAGGLLSDEPPPPQAVISPVSRTVNVNFGRPMTCSPHYYCCVEGVAGNGSIIKRLLFPAINLYHAFPILLRSACLDCRFYFAHKKSAFRRFIFYDFFTGRSQPSMLRCLPRAIASSAAATSFVMVDPAPTVAWWPTLTGATNAELEPIKA